MTLVVPETGRNKSCLERIRHKLCDGFEIETGSEKCIEEGLERI